MLPPTPLTLTLTTLHLLFTAAAAYTLDPPTTANPDTIPDCTYWHVAEATDTCDSISASYYITLAQFTTYVR
jgi:hypothetical protein